MDPLFLGMRLVTAAFCLLIISPMVGALIWVTLDPIREFRLARTTGDWRAAFTMQPDGTYRPLVSSPKRAVFRAERHTPMAGIKARWAFWIVMTLALLGVGAYMVGVAVWLPFRVIQP